MDVSQLKLTVELTVKLADKLTVKSNVTPGLAAPPFLHTSCWENVICRALARTRAPCWRRGGPFFHFKHPTDSIKSALALIRARL